MKTPIKLYPFWERIAPVTPAHFPPPETPALTIGQFLDPGQFLLMWSSRVESIAQRKGGLSFSGFPCGPSAAIVIQPSRSATFVKAGMIRMLEASPSLVPFTSRMGVAISGSKLEGTAIATRANSMNWFLLLATESFAAVESGRLNSIIRFGGVLYGVFVAFEVFPGSEERTSPAGLLSCAKFKRPARTQSGKISFRFIPCCYFDSITAFSLNLHPAELPRPPGSCAHFSPAVPRKTSGATSAIPR